MGWKIRKKIIKIMPINKDSLDENTRLQWGLYEYIEQMDFLVKAHKDRKIYLIKKMDDNLFALIERVKNIGMPDEHYYLHILKGIGKYQNETKAQKFERGGWCFVFYTIKELNSLKVTNQNTIEKCRVLLSLDNNIKVEDV